MFETTLKLFDGQLSFRCEALDLDEARPFTDEDGHKLRAWASRYAKALSKKADVAWPEYLALGSEMFAWLDGGERWLKRVLQHGITPPWLFAIQVSPDVSSRAAESALLGAPWELVRDEGIALAARADVLFNPLRRLGDKREPKAPSDHELSVMFMAAAPEGVSPLLFEEEEAAILDATRRLPLDLVVEESGSLERLAERMAEEAPLDVLQLSCHGNASPSPRLALEDERGRVHEVGPDALAQELGINLPSRLLFLSACETADPYEFVDTFAAQMIRRGVPAALGWGGSVRDVEATKFAAALYNRLTRKEPLEAAVALARVDLLEKLEQPADQNCRMPFTWRGFISVPRAAACSLARTSAKRGGRTWTRRF